MAPFKDPDPCGPTEVFTEVMDSEPSATVAFPEFMEDPGSEIPVENDKSKFFSSTLSLDRLKIVLISWPKAQFTR